MIGSYIRLWLERPCTTPQLSTPCANGLVSQHRKIIKTLATLILVAFAVCNSPVSAQQWIEYHPAGEGFRVEMPQTPQVASRVLQHKLGPLNMVEADVDFTDRSFAVSYIDFPADKIKSAANAESILDGARDGCC
jgi:hypothetical protein